MSKSGVISTISIVAGFFLLITMAIPFWNSDVKTDSDLKPSVESVKMANETRFAVLASVSHLENSYKVLCFAARKIANAEDVKEKHGLTNMVNVEWERVLNYISFIDIGLRMNNSAEGIKFLIENMEFKNNPRNAPEKLSESIEELEEKINLLRKILKINSASAIFEG